jgi:hypothetical protein
MSAVLRASAVSLALAIVASPAAAGQQGYLTPSVSVTAPAGWSLTPSLAVSQTYDDNVTLKGPGEPLVSDFVNTLNPSAELNYNGPRGQLSARYDGSFLLYRSTTSLDSYAQNGSFGAKRRLSSHTSFFVSGSAAAAPTTELVQLTAVPYVRTGARTEDARAGIETVISKRLSIVANVHGQGVHFDDTAPFANLLLGGTSFGGGFVLRERLSEMTTLTADYDGQRADIGERHDVFVIQNATVGLERLLTRTTRISAAIGVARLDAPSFGPAKTGPSYRFSLSRDLRSSVVDLILYRSFVPSWSFGGTTQNQEATVRLRVPLARRLYAQSLVSWRNDEPIVEITPPLKSLWIQGTVGYTARPWVRIEGYYLGTRQTVVTPDAFLRHNEIGFQVIAGKPVRLR